eukprot:4020012-Amphidinium_carterae.2
MNVTFCGYSGCSESARMSPIVPSAPKCEQNGAGPGMSLSPLENLLEYRCKHLAFHGRMLVLHKNGNLWSAMEWTVQA